MAEQNTSRNSKRTILSILAGLLLVFFLGLFLLPNLISTDWAGNKAKQIVNSRIPGQVDFRNVSLSWFNGIQCQEFSYDNPDKGILIKVADISMSKGLLGLATNYREMGEVTVKEPNAYVYLQEQPAPVEAGTGAPSETKEAATTEKRGQDTGTGSNSTPLTFPAIEGKLNITGGAVTAVLPDKKEKHVLKNLNLQLKVNGRENLLDYLVAFQSGDDTGQVKGQGTVTLPEGDLSKLDKIQSEATLDIDNWEITDLLSILAAIADMPTGSGLLNGHMKISGSTETAVQIQGNLTGRQIRLQGGPLKSDTPSFELIEAVFDGEKTASAFTLNRLALTSPLATGTATGFFASDNKKEIDSQAVIDLAEVFAQFPGTLNLKEGIKISTGKIDLIAKVTTTDEATLFEGSARLDKLQGLSGKKKLSWNKPVTLIARGEQSQKGLRLENFTVQSSFLNGSGQGDMNHMQIQLKADIGAALVEIEKFIQIEDWKSSGKMDMNLQVDTKTESVRSITGDVNIKDFALRQKDRVIAPPGGFKANLTTDLVLDREMRPREMLDTVMDFQSWIGSGAVTFKNFIPASEGARVQINDLGFKGAFDLGHMSALLQSLDALPQDTRLTGKSDIDTRLSIKGNRVELGDTTVDTKDFILQRTKQKFSEKKIHLTTRGVIDLGEKSAALKPVELQTSTGHVTIPELLLTDWSRLEESIKTNGSIELDLGMLTTLLGDAVKLPPGTTVAGKGAVTMNVDLTNAQQQSVQLNGLFGPLAITSHNKPLVSEDNIQMVLDLNGDVRKKNFTLNKLEFSSVPVVLNATGKVTPDKKEHLLISEGSIGFDLKALSSYLKTLADVEVEMTGVTKRPFTLKARSINGEWTDIPQNADFSTSFYAESIRAFGMHIASLEVPIRLADSLGEVNIQGTVNRGRIALKPVIDFSAEPHMMSIPDNSSVLTGVGLTEDMSNDLLAKLHPVFKGAAVSQGTVDLTMQSFSWPLDAKARKDAAFTGTLIFNDTRLQAGGLLVPLLAVMKANEREIIVGDKPVEFIGANDRVQCSPMEIKIKEYTIMLSGSIGFDQSLDYIAQIPVTRKMVGGDVYEYLEGTYISVPITGTVSKPAINRNVVQAALKDLIGQAGKKQLTEQAGKLLQKLFQ
jgi:hypothetical protein